ncbi:MAG: sulfite exporter TauE/SafE family protein, partial [Candidatus Omnitrophica bacterium]|nr:sulfite exporter TauE/SafE family protein [Candidatus Omnitrophota bacterium]
TTHFVANSSNLRLGVAACTALGAIFGARAGVFLAEKINSKTLKIIFAILLIFIGVRLLGLAKTPAGTSSQILAYPFLIMLGLAAGMASSLLGIGGGVLLVPGLMILFGLGPHEAIATSLAVVFPTAIVGAIFHSKSFKINSKVLKTLIPAALAGAVLGAIATNMVPAKLLQNIFAVFMFICAVKLFLQKEKGLEES